MAARLLINNFPFQSRLLTYPSDLLEHLNRQPHDPELCTLEPIAYQTDEIVEQMMQSSPDLLRRLAERLIRLSRIDARGVVPITFAELTPRELDCAVGVYLAHRGVAVNALAYNELRDRVVSGGEIPRAPFPVHGMYFTDAARDLGLRLIAEKKRFVWKDRQF